MPYKDPAEARARWRNRDHLKRVAVSDITHAQELAMRKRARKCPMPGCGVRMTDKPHLPNSKELDHILPVNQGGTHTHGNVRIICRKCNQSRPKDGSDYTGMLTLWAQDPNAVSRKRTTCKAGLHPWIPANIATRNNGKKQCKACELCHRPRQAPKQCKCGALFAASGRQFMCPACIDATAHKAAELHAQGGLTWKQVAEQVGYGSANGEGARWAAKRIGYMAAPVVRTPPRRLCPGCGEQPLEKYARRCGGCNAEKAWQAVELYNGGMALRPIADLLGYNSITAVSNLMKSVTDIDMRIGRPHS